MTLGEQLREARIVEGLTIAQVAKSTGLSSGYISQVERDLANPSVGALDRIAAALGVRMRTFFDNSEGSNSPTEPGADSASGSAVIGLVRRDGRKRFLYPGSEILHELLCPDLRHTLEILKTTAPVGTDSGHTGISHEGEECAIVLNGSMELFLGDERFFLETGDSLCFDPSVSHFWRNAGVTELEVLWVITPPSF